MPPTTAAGAAASGAPPGPPGSSAAARQDSAAPAALSEGQRSAECELAEALARFQAEVTPAKDMSLPAVVEAARGAFRLGFAYSSCRALDEEGQPLLEVTVMHRGGDQLSSQVHLTTAEAEQEFTQAARLLAQLLGIPVLSVTHQAQPQKAEVKQTSDCRQAGPAAIATSEAPVSEEPQGSERTAAAASHKASAAAATDSIPASPAAAATTAPPAQPAPAAPAPAPGSAPTQAQAPAQAPEAAANQAAATPLPAVPGSAAAAAAPAAPVDTIGPGSPDAPGTEESLRPLGTEERETLLEMIRCLRPVEARRQFQIAFRHHFKVPKEARTISGFITQQRHKNFIDRFERELADLPAADATTTTAAMETNP